MLRFGPERLGHCVKTVRDPGSWNRLRERRIPVELCITSNVITDSIHGGNGNGGGGGGGGGGGSHAVDVAAAAAKHHLGLMHAAGRTVPCTARY